MSMRSWIRNVFARPATRPTRQAPQRARLALELLEDRCVPAHYTVINADYSGAGSLGDAIAAAVAVNDSSARIHFDLPESSVIRLGSNTVDPAAAAYGPTAYIINGGAGTSITIDGSGAPFLSLNGGFDQGVRLFVVAANNTLTLENLTLTSGHARGDSAERGGGGGGAGMGGAIYNDGGSVTARGCTLFGNRATGGDGSNGASEAGGGYGDSGGAEEGGPGGFGGGGGGGDHGGDGGFGGGGGGGFLTGGAPGFGGGRGVGALEVSQGDFEHSNGGGGAGLGGAIFADGGTLTLINSTFVANQAFGGEPGRFNSVSDTHAEPGTSFGGAIFVRNGALTLTSCTLGGNSLLDFNRADAGSGVYLLGDGASASAAINNTIIAQSDTSWTDLEAHSINGSFLTITSGRGNLIRREINFNGEVVSNANPLLSRPTRNGGPTATVTLLAGSPAINQGENQRVGDLATDQRGPGFARISGGTVDIGAVEVQGASLATTTTVTASPTPSTFGDEVTFTATVASSSTPVGTVHFVIDSGTPVAGILTGTTATTATWTFMTSTLQAGSHSVGASFTSSGTFNDSDGTLSGGQVVDKANATVVVTSYHVAYDGWPQSATVTSITGVNGETGDQVGTVTLSAAHTNAGTYSDSWSFTGTANYHDIASTTLINVIAKANPIVVVAPYTVKFDGQPHTASYTILGVLGETGGTVGTVDVSNTTHTDVGIYSSDSWSFSGSANYNDVAPTTITNIITPPAEAGRVRFNPRTGAITIRGTSDADKVRVVERAGGAKILVILSTPGGSTIRKTFAASRVKRVIFESQGGDDVFINATNVPLWSR